MVAVRTAIDSAFVTLGQLIQDAKHPQLEEVLLGPEERTWRITLSYLVPFIPNELAETKQSSSPFLGAAETKLRPLGDIKTGDPLLIRRYKTLEFDRDSGDFKQLLARELGKD